MPEGDPQGLVFLFSDETGPTAELTQAAAQLATLGLIVAPVALRPFLDRQDIPDQDCLYLVSDIEEASRRIQAAGGRGHYLTPIVAGTGMGAAVAYAAMAQAPDATLAGAASDGFTTRITTRPRFAPERRHPGGRRRVRVRPGPPARLVARGGDAGGREGADLRRRRRCGRRCRGRGRRRQRSWRPLSRLLEAPLAAAAAETLAGLPLIELPVTEPGKLMAVVYSGDGGWRDIDKEIAGRLQAKGIPVVGVDSLRYFWSEKTPEQAAADLDLIMDHYREAWQRPDVLLIGYSFGANALPFAFNRLPKDQQAHMRRLALLGLAMKGDLQIHVTSWLGADAHEGALDILPELVRIPPKLIQCFYGMEETDTACTRPELKGAS